jgi:hypothetical protein
MSCATKAKAVAWEETAGEAVEDKMAFFRRGSGQKSSKTSVFGAYF